MKNAAATKPKAETPSAPVLPFGAAAAEVDPKVDAAGKKLSPLEQDELAQQGKVLAILEKHRETGSYLEVSCREPGKMDWDFLDIIPLESYNLKFFSDRFGGGAYRLIAKTDRHNFITTWFVNVSKSIQPVRGTAAQPAAAAQNEVAAAMREFKETMKPLIDRALAPQSPQESGLKELTPIITAALARPEPKNDSMEMFKYLAEMQQRSEARFEKMMEKLAEKKEPPRDKFRDALEEKMVDQLLEGGSDKDDKKGSFFERMAEALAPAVAPLLQQMVSGNGQFQNQQRQLQPAAVRSAGTGAAATTEPIKVTPTTEPAINDEMNIQLKFMLAQFKTAALKAAENGQDAAEFALTTLGMIPENYHAQIFSAANADDWFNNLFASDPKATKYLEFMTEIRNTLLAQSVVFVARANVAQNASATETAKVIIASLSKSFHEYLFNETHKENWSILFKSATFVPRGVESDPLPIPADWLETLRIAIDNALGGEEKPAAAAAEKSAGS